MHSSFLLLSVVVTLATLTCAYKMGYNDGYEDDQTIYHGSDDYRPHYAGMGSRASWGHFANQHNDSVGSATSKLKSRIAWLEYLANSLIQCDDFHHARMVVKEMNQYLGRVLAVNDDLTTAIQLIQDRIDKRQDCLSQVVKKGLCKSFRSHENHLNGDNWYGEVTAVATEHLAPVMERPSSSQTTPQQEAQMEDVMLHLVKGDLAKAKEVFNQLPTSNALSRPLDDLYGKMYFILRLVDFDMRHSDSCMPLWRDECCLNWHMKLKVMQIFDEVMDNSFRPYQHIENIMGKLQGIPTEWEIRSRILVSAGRPEAHVHLSPLKLAEKYLSKACLILKKVPDLNVYNPRAPLPGDDDIKVQARAVYDSCSKDPGVSRKDGLQCREGRRVIDLIQKECPKAGIVWMGVEPLVFGENLFLLCSTGGSKGISIVAPKVLDRETQHRLRQAQGRQKLYNARYEPQIVPVAAIPSPQIQVPVYSPIQGQTMTTSLPPYQATPIIQPQPILQAPFYAPPAAISNVAQQPLSNVNPKSNVDYDSRLHDFMDQLRDPNNTTTGKKTAEKSAWRNINDYEQKARGDALLGNLN